jgi:3-oxoacyl-[acyl-carrier protein] reductase
MELDGMSALVTGASGGIGAAISKAIAMEGGKVALTGRNVGRLEAVHNEIKEAGGESTVFVADLLDEGQIDKLVADVKTAYGDIDILVNNAGVFHIDGKSVYGKNLWEIPLDEWEMVFDIKFWPAYLLCRSLIPGMIKKGRGKIVNITGTFDTGGPGSSHYYLGTLALEHLNLNLAEELKPHNVQVNAVNTGLVSSDAVTALHPEESAKAQTPEELAQFTLFFMTKQSDNITGSSTIIEKVER